MTYFCNFECLFWNSESYGVSKITPSLVSSAKELCREHLDPFPHHVFCAVQSIQRKSKALSLSQTKHRKRRGQFKLGIILGQTNPKGVPLLSFVNVSSKRQITTLMDEKIQHSKDF